MYCKKCGCKLTGRETKCPNCGAEGHPMEYTNGFWDLYQGKPSTAAPTMPTASGAETDRLRQEVTWLEQQVRQLHRSQRLVFRINSGVALVLLLLIVLLFFRSCSQGRDIAEMSAEYETLATTVHTQAEQVAQLSDTVKEQERVLSTLSQENDPGMTEAPDSETQEENDGDGIEDPEGNQTQQEESAPGEEGTGTADSGTTTEPDSPTDPDDSDGTPDPDDAAAGLPEEGSTGVQPGARGSAGTNLPPVV